MQTTVNNNVNDPSDEIHFFRQNQIHVRSCDKVADHVSSMNACGDYHKAGPIAKWAKRTTKIIKLSEVPTTKRVGIDLDGSRRNSKVSPSTDYGANNTPCRGVMSFNDTFLEQTSF